MVAAGVAPADTDKRTNPCLPGGIDRAVARLGQRPAALHLLYGLSSLYTGSMLLGVATRRPFAVIDGATRFNSYALSRTASLLRIPAKAALQRVHVTRSFTAFQTEAAVTTKLVRFLDAVPSCRLVIVLGLLHTYYDGQVKPHECVQSLRRVLHALHAVTDHNVHVLIADQEVAAAPPGKEALFRLVHRSADLLIELDQSGFTARTAEPRRCREENKKKKEEKKGSYDAWGATTTPSPLSSQETRSSGTSSAGR